MSTGAKQWEVETMEELGGYGTLGVYVRGHHDPTDVLAYCQDAGYADESVTVEDVRHVRFRKTPWREGGAGYYQLNEGSGRGTFPATLVDILGARERRRTSTPAAPQGAEGEE